MGTENHVLSSTLKLLTPPSSLKPIARCSPTSSTSTPPLSYAATQSVIQNSGVIACLRASSAELAYEAASIALTGGISALEITMSTPGVFEALGQLVLEHPYSVLGVGTVLNVKDARKAVDIGAKFLMSPATVQDIMDDFRASDILYIPGAMTPTEILSAYNGGAKLVKVYPVSTLGGVKYISALSKSFPHIPLVASQGVTTDSIGDFINCGASAVVLSGAIFCKPLLERKDFEKIHKLARFASMKGKEAVKQYVSSSL